jgi:hypothetical protein
LLRYCGSVCCVERYATQRSQGPRPPEKEAAHVLRLTEKEFKLCYRLDHTRFYKLRDLLESDLKVQDTTRAQNGRRGAVVPIEVKLAIALRYFAGGSPLDLRLIYHVSHDYYYHRHAATGICHPPRALSFRYYHHRRVVELQQRLGK